MLGKNTTTKHYCPEFELDVTIEFMMIYIDVAINICLYLYMSECMFFLILSSEKNLKTMMNPVAMNILSTQIVVSKYISL